MLDRKFALRHANIGLNPFCSVMSHELGHALGNAAIGRKSTVKLQTNGFGRCEFPLDGKHDPRDEIFVAALGSAAQLAYIRMATEGRSSSIPEVIFLRFCRDYVWYPNSVDWKRLRQHNSSIKLSIESFQLLTEKLAARIEKDKSLLKVIGKLATTPQNLSAEQIETIATSVSKPLSKLRTYARRCAGRLLKQT